MALHGWLIIDKPVGPGSTDVVSAVKRALRAGGYPKVKVGHGGTLDPLASGVLPVALGEATKLCGRALDSDKRYEFTIRFGVETSTLDAEGEVVVTSEKTPSEAEVHAVLPRFTGTIEQVPPSYSALKIDGRRAYDLARSGEAVEMKAREVTVHSLQVLPGTGRGAAGTAVEGARRHAECVESPLHHASHGPPPRAGEDLGGITLSASVSKGTYIRSLARDIAYALDTVGHVTMLRRVKAGSFGLSHAISLDKLGELAQARQLEQALLPLTAGLDDIPALPVTPDQARALREGRRLVGIAAKPGLHLATDASVPVALVELSEGELRVVRGFNLGHEGV
nr:tRNA pseudouridine(55) synthase TruB [uncultured Sphingosinicella sp.]